VPAIEAATSRGFDDCSVDQKAMRLELDHVFVCCATGASEAEALLALGIREGSSNVHPGQGTSNRRFFFENFYLELLWVANAVEARSERTWRTRLWERWSGRASGACPFGVIFRPTKTPVAAPFATWSYQPQYLPAGASIEFARGVPIEEPELACLSFVRGAGTRDPEPTDHKPPIRTIAGLVIALPTAATLSATSRAAAAAGLVRYQAADEYLLQIEFVAERERTFDLRPTLPVMFKSAPRANA
jgi:hypothetical protein